MEFPLHVLGAGPTFGANECFDNFSEDLEVMIKDLDRS